jgi:hypothetical protein
MVWLVRPQRADILGTPNEWLAFQREDGTERRRLSEVAANWEGLGDDRLDLLRRMATPVTLVGGLNRTDAESDTGSWPRR